MRIAKRRAELELSREELAEAVGVSVAAVGQWESGKTKNLKLDHLIAIADALNINVRWLATGVGSKEAAQSMQAYSTALSRRDEAKNDRQKKAWERIAAGFAKAATVLLLAVPTLLPSKSEGAALFNINIYRVTHWLRFALQSRVLNAAAG